MFYIYKKISKTLHFHHKSLSTYHWLKKKISTFSFPHTFRIFKKKCSDLLLGDILSTSIQTQYKCWKWGKIKNVDSSYKVLKLDILWLQVSRMPIFKVKKCSMLQFTIYGLSLRATRGRRRSIGVDELS